MTLTIPKAGTIAGRAAQVQVSDANPFAALSELGQNIADQAIRYKAEKMDMQGKRLQMDIARDMALARQEVDQLGDPDAIAQTWEARNAEIRAKYAGTGEDGQPLVPDALRDPIDLTMGELNNRHSLALGDKAIALRQSQREATWLEMRDQVAVDAARADPETAASMLEIANGAIDSRVQLGQITPEEGAKEKLALRGEIASARAIAQVEADPQAFLADAAKGKHDELGAEDLARKSAAAQAEIYRRAAAEAKATEAVAADREKAISKRLADVTDLMLGGFRVTDEAFLQDPEVQANPNYAAAAAAQSLRDEQPGLQQMTPAQIDALIDAEQASPKTHKFETERLAVLKTWRDNSQKRWNTDGKTVAAEAGMRPPPLPAFDPDQPQAFAAALASAVVFDAMVRGQGYTDTQAMVTPQEKAQVQTVLDPKADAGPKVALARTILQAAGPDASRVLTVLEADPVFIRTTKILTQTGDDALATSILRGQQKAERGLVNLPSPANRRSVFNDATGGVFAYNPALADEIMQAASALYADEAAGINPDGAASALPFMDDTEAVEVFGRAIQRVTGAKPDQNGDYTIGGIQLINDGFVSLPPGVPLAAVESALDSLDRHLRGQRRSANGWDSSASSTPPDMLRAFRAASVDGRVPDFGAAGSARLAGAQMQRLLTRAGEETDQYRFVTVRNGRAYPLADAKGVEYRFRLPTLIIEAGK